MKKRRFWTILRANGSLPTAPLLFASRATASCWRFSKEGVAQVEVRVLPAKPRKVARRAR